MMTDELLRSRSQSLVNDRHASAQLAAFDAHLLCAASFVDSVDVAGSSVRFPAQRMANQQDTGSGPKPVADHLLDCVSSASLL